MKKIIAAAVATAFVAPVMAADITLSGEVEYYYKSPDVGEDSLNDAETNIFVSGSSELNNGWTISTTIAIRQNEADPTAEGSSALKLGMGEFGTLEVGDTAGALDAFDDVADVSAQGGGSVSNQDAAISYTLPTLVEGLTVRYSMSPDSTSISGETNHVTADYNGIAAKYVFNNYTLYYGQDEWTVSGEAQEQTGFGVTADFAPFAVAYEAASLTDGAAATTDHRDYATLAATYDVGNGMKVAVANHTVENGAGTVTDDITSYSLFYTAGAGVKFYVESADDAKDASTAATYAGVEYKF
jgi:hypothetical protein